VIIIITTAISIHEYVTPSGVEFVSDNNNNKINVLNEASIGRLTKGGVRITIPCEAERPAS